MSDQQSSTEDWKQKLDTIASEFNSLVLATEVCMQCQTNEIISNLRLLNAKLMGDSFPKHDTLIVFTCSSCAENSDSRALMTNVQQLAKDYAKQAPKL